MIQGLLRILGIDQPFILNLNWKFQRKKTCLHNWETIVCPLCHSTYLLAYFYSEKMWAWLGNSSPRFIPKYDIVFTIKLFQKHSCFCECSSQVANLYDSNDPYLCSLIWTWSACGQLLMVYLLGLPKILQLPSCSTFLFWIIMTWPSLSSRFMPQF